MLLHIIIGFKSSWNFSTIWMMLQDRMHIFAKQQQQRSAEHSSTDVQLVRFCIASKYLLFLLISIFL